MPQLHSLLTATLAILSSSAFAQTTPTPTPSAIGTGVTVAPPAATNPNPNSLSGLVSRIPTCALPCFESAAKKINCAATDFTCLCRSDQAAMLSTTLATCVGTDLLFGHHDDGLFNDNDLDDDIDDHNDNDKDDNDKNDDCDADDLAELAVRICAAVLTNPDQSQLAAATSIVSQGLAAASPGPANGGVRTSAAAGRVVRTAGGLLAAVAIYVVLVL